MRTITVCYDGSLYTYKWVKTLFVARKYFKESGFVIKYTSLLDFIAPVFIYNNKFFHDKSLKILCTKKHDIVFMAFHHSRSYLGKMEEEERGNILKKIKSNCNKLVWLDTADSTGTCLFDVMPYVDIYMKKQLLKNREDYCKPYYGGRIFTDYYHKHLNIDDEKLSVRNYPVLDIRYLNKLRVSWNLALCDLFASGLQIMIPWHLTKARFTSPSDTCKTLDLQFRGSSGYTPLIGYQRAKTCELLNNVRTLSHCNPIERITFKDYVKEMRSAKGIFSPFGWGEVCFRDFEVFQFGALLIKNSMEHCETYPDSYKENETYVPINWDFSNFNEVLANFKEGHFSGIALNGQKHFKFERSKDGLRAFAKHIVKEIQ